MMNLKSWVKAMRLKTLPLALASTIVGSSLAYSSHIFSWTICILALLTTLSLQILSNLANDYGDFKNGKDTDLRIGPDRMVHTGKISAREMLGGVIVFVALSLIFGIWLIIEGTRGLDVKNVLIFLILGLLAITAAIKYTVGKNPYGYKAMGDIFVFLFFGLAAVCGTYFLHTHQINYDTLLPASAMGLLSAGVLNLNNLRDYQADKATKKYTLVVALGLNKARIYHAFLLMTAFYLCSLYNFKNYESAWQWLYLLSFPLIFRNLRVVLNFEDHNQLFDELRNLSLSSLVFALLFSLGLILS